MKRLIQKLSLCWDILMSDHFIVYTAKEKANFSVNAKIIHINHLKEKCNNLLDQESALSEVEYILNNQ